MPTMKYTLRVRKKVSICYLTIDEIPKSESCENQQLFASKFLVAQNDTDQYEIPENHQRTTQYVRAMHQYRTDWSRFCSKLHRSTVVKGAVHLSD